MTELKPGQQVRYSEPEQGRYVTRRGTILEVNGHRDWDTVIVKSDVDGLTHVTLRGRVTPLDPRKEMLEKVFDIMTTYLLDECSEGTNWEDFDPDIDGLREQVAALGGEA